MIGSVDYFSQLSEDLKEELHYKLTIEYFDPGANVFCSGDECKALYFVANGEIDLLI
jgi:signal-transduction protein with cAMP-binding, CBS, and nucleotidyltransferase domain